MLRDYSDSLSSFLLRAFPAGKGYARAEFTRDPMPPPVAHFLAQTLQARLDIEVERHRSVRSHWFDYEHPEVQHAQLTFAAVLGQHARIPQEDWARLVRDAALTVLSYLVRPVPTLVDFLFDEQEEEAIPASDVLRGLGFFSAYPYLREVTTAYLKQRGLQEVERERLQTVLRHSDREMTRDYDAASWLKLLAPLFTLFEADLAEAGRGVPVEALAAFFEDKEAGYVLARLQERAAKPGGRITEDDLRVLLERPSDAAPVPATPRPAAPPADLVPELPGIPTSPEPVTGPEEPESVIEPGEPEPPTVLPGPVPEPAPPGPVPPDPLPEPEPPTVPPGPPRPERPEVVPTPTPVPPEPAPARPVPGPVAPQAPPAQAPAAVPLWQKFQKPAPPPSAPAAPPTRPLREAERPASVPRVQVQARPAAPAPPPVSAAEERAAGSRVPLWMQFRKAKPEEAAPEGLPELEASVLGESDRRRRDVFVKQLFSGSQAEYERVLRRLETASSWGGASQIIAEEVFRKHRVNIYSEAAVTFTNAVEEQYR